MNNTSESLKQPANVISFANVAARYDGGQEVLSDVSFNINDHSFYFLTGASGAGKTTLLRLIYQLHQQSRGQIKLFGKSTAGMSHHDITDLRRKMAIIFQEHSLINNLSVFDNIALPLRVRGAEEKHVQKLAAKTLQWVGLSQYANALPLTLSGGQQQKVAVARAIITQPEILLADEPTGNLDDDSAAKLIDLFLQMNKSFGTSIIIATHSHKLLTTYSFPRILIEDRHVKFQNVSEKSSSADSEKKPSSSEHPATSGFGRRKIKDFSPDYFAKLSNDITDQLETISDPKPQETK